MGKSFEVSELEMRMQQKERELYEQLTKMERERTSLREDVIRLEEKCNRLATEREEATIEVTELRKHVEIYEEKIQQHQNMRDDKLAAHIATIKELELQVD
jgi:pyridoxal biosynthesis lyase PdxS